MTPENYQSEAERERSFMGRTLNGVNSEKLAHAGFLHWRGRQGSMLQMWRYVANGDRMFYLMLINSNPYCLFLQIFASKRKSEML